MHDPIYECTGPNATEVRAHQLRLFLSRFLTETKEEYSQVEKTELEYIISHILKQYIPDTMADFGSYRGYFTYGLDKQLINNIDAEIRSQMKSLMRINHS